MLHLQGLLEELGYPGKQAVRQIIACLMKMTSKTDSIMNTALTSATSRISSSCNTWNLSSTNLTVTLWKTNPRLTTSMKHPSCGNAAPPGFAGRAGLSWKASSQTDHRMSDENDIQNWFNHEHGLDFSYFKNFLILQYLKSKFNQLNSDSLKTNPRLTTCMKHPSCGNAAPPGFAGRAGLSWKASSQTDHRMSDENDIQNWFNHEHGLDFSHLKNFLILQYLKSKFNQLNSDSLKNKSKADYIYETSVLRQRCTSRVCWKSWSNRSSHVWWKWHPKLIQSWTRPWLQPPQEFPHPAILEI